MEKSKIGGSMLGSLHANYPGVRNDASFEKDYLLGKYGAIPKLNTQMSLFDPPPENKL